MVKVYTRRVTDLVLNDSWRIFFVSRASMSAKKHDETLIKCDDSKPEVVVIRVAFDLYFNYIIIGDGFVMQNRKWKF